MTKIAILCLIAGTIMFITGQMPTLSIIVLVVGGLLLLAAIIRYRNSGTEASAVPKPDPSAQEPTPVR